jgi:Glycosyl transferase family 2
MAQVRVFVPTYRRPALLPRALNSLLAQTFAQWTCEIHNDDPADAFPGELVRSLGDPRITLQSHVRNLGANATFNLFYRPTDEEFYCLLEDDNWWEPEFLQTMVAALRAHPQAVMAWCNQKVWEELPDGSWRDTGALANTVEGRPSGGLVEFGGFRQIMGALHGNGAMLMRSQPGETYQVPADWPFVAIEPFRERMIRHPLLYVPKPLAVFCRTLQTARSETRAEWLVVQTILAATYFKHCDFPQARLAELFAEARAMRPPATTPMLLAVLIEPECRRLLRHCRPHDWVLLLRGLARWPQAFAQALRSRRRHAAWWKSLDGHTATRFAERRRRATESPPCAGGEYSVELGSA